ncbi:conserved hypothetical protein [Thiomonas delicata]|uniref:Uncharacterized protein n=1 Tax=Thiomonas delicata TaxID=364030 RepID=A0A238D917_THIDL|nr:conserved hypothetical protein [Thiomonas delicata]
MDAAELQMSANSACMAQAIHQATEGGRAITYAQLDALKARCGE